MHAHVAMVTGYPAMGAHVKGIYPYVSSHVKMVATVALMGFANVPLNGVEKLVRRM